MGKGDGMSARTTYLLPKSVALVLILLLLALWLVVGCGGSREESQQQESVEEPVRGTFVGKALNADAFIALIADEAKEKGGHRKVRAYLSNGTRNPLSEWFWGSVPGNELDFTSINGAQLKGILTPEAAHVTITLDSGTSFAFSANRVNGVNGLYNVHIEDDGSFSGTRETGGERMEGRIAEGANSEGWHAVDATITPPEGEPTSFKMAASNRLSGDARLIVSGSDIVGASKRYGDRTGYISINSDLVR
jgi:hypothetical protein